MSSTAPYVPIFYAQPAWVTMSHYDFEPACLQAVRRLPSSTYNVRKILNSPDIFVSGPCVIGVYLTKPPASQNPPQRTTWNTIKRYALQAVSQLGLHGGGASLNLPSGMQIAVYEKSFIDSENICGTRSTYQQNRGLTLEECLNQRGIEKGLIRPELVPIPEAEEAHTPTPQELSEIVQEYMEAIQTIPSTASTEVQLDSIIAQVSAESTSLSSSDPVLSPPQPMEPTPPPSPGPVLSPPTPMPPRPKPKKPKPGRGKKSSLTETSSVFPTMSVGNVNAAGLPVDTNVPRHSWARYGKLSPQLCNKAFASFRALLRQEDTRSKTIMFRNPEIFVASPCAIGVYLAHPDAEFTASAAFDTWTNIEKKARLLTLAVTKDGGSGGFIELESGVQIVVFDRPYMDPSFSLEAKRNIPLVYALDQVVYARDHGGTTLPWTPPTMPTMYHTGGQITTSNPVPLPPPPLGGVNVFVAIMDSWVSEAGLPADHCRNTIRMLASYDPILERPTIKISQPVIFYYQTCALGVFLTNPPLPPIHAITVVDTEGYDVALLAESLVEKTVGTFGVGGYVDVPNGLQIAVWEKGWADPSRICARIINVTLQKCLDMLVSYNTRVRRSARFLAELASAGVTPRPAQMSLAAHELFEGGSAVARALLGPNALVDQTEPLIPTSIIQAFTGLNPATAGPDPVFPITAAPAMPSGTGGVPFGTGIAASTSQTSQQGSGAAASPDLDSVQMTMSAIGDRLPGEDLPMQLFGQPGRDYDSTPRAGQGEMLRAQYLGGVVLPGNAAHAVARRVGLSAPPQVGDPYTLAGRITGVVVGEGGYVDAQLFMTATGYLPAATSGRIVMVEQGQVDYR